MDWSFYSFLLFERNWINPLCANLEIKDAFFISWLWGLCVLKGSEKSDWIVSEAQFVNDSVISSILYIMALQIPRDFSSLDYWDMHFCCCFFFFFKAWPFTVDWHVFSTVQFSARISKWYCKINIKIGYYCPNLPFHENEFLLKGKYLVRMQSL